MILYGARQVGKTWLLKEFGHKEFMNTVYLNFDDDKKLGEYFNGNLDTVRLIKALESHFNEKIDPKTTLIIFDELQECQLAKDSLKYFNENSPQYHIACAGSFLGVSGGKFPVGQVNSLTLYPMSFYEFLDALGKKRLLDAIKNFDFPLLESLSPLFNDMLKTYFYIGGMPEAVDSFVVSSNLDEVRQIQKEIVQNYRSDFSKHITPNNISKVHMLWDTIPVHLAREKKKFIYRDLKTGGRSREFEDALDWLINTGLVYKIPRTLSPNLPLARDQEREAFKLFFLDTGLLGSQINIDKNAFYEADPKIFRDFHGAMSEQYVCQELKTAGNISLFYWGRDKGEAEVDFLIQHKNNIIPIEVKSERNTQSKSLKVYMEKYKPIKTIKTSMRNFGIKDSVYSVPLYMISSLPDLLEKT